MRLFVLSGSNVDGVNLFRELHKWPSQSPTFPHRLTLALPQFVVGRRRSHKRSTDEGMLALCSYMNNACQTPISRTETFWRHGGKPV